ncbi:MAG: IS200/IS605 family transposase [Acidobacteriota bacterium]
MPSTFTSLHYHIVFGTKQREPFLSMPLRDRVHEYLGGCIRTIGGLPLEIGGVSDHVHILARLKPTHCVADVLRDIKKASSEWVREQCRAFRWQDGYSAFTVAASQIERVRRYVVSQAAHHARTTFEDEYRELLRAHGIEFDERYLL